MKKNVVTLLCAAMTACAPLTLPAPGDSVALSQGWTLEKDGEKALSFEATVPSTVAGTLYSAGFWGEDLLEGTRYAQADRSLFDSSWTYTAAFAGKPAPGEHVQLVFDGLGYRADIFLNGRQLASSDTTAGVFIRRAYDVTACLEGRNSLKVKLQRARPGDLNIGFVDWNPRPLDESMGLVRPVTLHTTRAVSIEDVLVIPDLDTEGFREADLRVRVTLRNLEQRPVEAVLSLALEGEKASVAVPLSPGETRELSLSPADVPLLHVDSPRVWWTHDLGTPELYRLLVSAEEDARLSDRRETVFGIRKIESRLTEDNHRQFSLNGRDILLKGAGWTDDIFLLDTPGSIDRQLRYVADMHLNLIRFENVWGKDDLVYDLCDRYGILSLVGFSCQWEWESYCGLPEVKGYGCINTPESEDLAVRYFHDQVVRLHNHPSLIAWMTGSDRIPNPGLERRYLAVYEHEDYRPYICSAKGIGSLAGWSGTKMEGPYEYVGPDYWYKDKKRGGAYGWNTETGIGANLPQLESLRRMIPDGELWPLSSSWDAHCTASATDMNSTRELEKAVTGLYGGYHGLEDFVHKAHALDYDGTRGMFEAFRVRIPKTTGLVQWMLNSAWPSLYWQLYDWYGVPTAGYYGCRKACEPLQLIFDYESRQVVAVNESAAPGPCRLLASVKVFDEDSRPIGEESREASVGYREVVPVFDLSAYDGKPHFVALELQMDGETVSDNFYALPACDNEYAWDQANWYVTPIARYANLGFAFGERKADVRMTVDGTRITLKNHSDVISYQNILKAKDGEGRLVVPAFWSDNFFPLLPGQEKTVTCTLDTDPSLVHFELDNGVR